MVRRLLGINDLTSDEVRSILARAALHADGATSAGADGALISLAFFQPSLRTRTGFESAALRIGGHPIVVNDRRSSDVSLTESVEDTLRVLSGYSDALVVRAGRPAGRLDAAIRHDTPWLNGGCEAEHPSQALIDIFAIERLVGPVADLHVAITGDVRMRAARSLLRLLTRSRPGRLTVVSDPELGVSDPVVTMSGATILESVAELDDVDVLYAVGIPKGPGETVRSRLRVGQTALQALSARGVVLSPLPLIDEIALSVRDDPRMRFFEQSDLGLFVRMAMLEDLLGVG